MTTSKAVSCEWTVTGMDCGSCAGKVRGAVARLPGVSQVDVALMTERLRLTLDEQQSSRARVEAAVKELGFGIFPKGTAPENNRFVLPEGAFPDNTPDAAVGGDPAPGAPGHARDAPTERARFWYTTGKGQLVIATGLLLAAAWAVRMSAPGQLATLAFGLATLIGVAPIARRAVNAARAGMPFTIEMLMTIAATGALFIGAAEEAALVVFLFAVGEVLEGVAANKARDSIRGLARLVPKTALVEVRGNTREVAAESLRVGQTVLVRPGDRVPADGDVIDGNSGVDESPVTGESVPRMKAPGDEVFAGSINTEAALRIRVSKAAEDNTIARIIRLVEEAESARAPTERFIDRFSRLYMPAIVGIAVVVAVIPPLAFGQDWGPWIYRALALLLIGCPCALVISVPAAIASALSAGARRGILMKGGAVIEAAARVNSVAFDKTGTLTLGRPVVTDIVPITVAEADLLAIAAGVETASSHPLAEAILRRAKAAGVAPRPATGARAVAGNGVMAELDGATVTVGSPRHARDKGALDAGGLARAAALEAVGKTVVAVFGNGETFGLIAMRDEPRADAREAVRQLSALGICATMLTGDNARTGAAIAGTLGIGYRAELMPDDKVALVRDMAAQGGVVMVGDGINDAPALASATVGIAMGSGSDVALETADGALLRNRVSDVAAMIRLARAAMGNIRQNVTIALGLKAVFLVTTILGMTGLWLAILADTGATVLVTLNALRLLAFNPEREH